MRIADCNWMQLERYLEHDDRIVLPLGSTEQHAYLSLATDSILAERIATEAAEPLGIPVLPVLPYGLTPAFAAYPGTLTLRLETFAAVVRDLLDSLRRSGFRRILIVNGHGGNEPMIGAIGGWVTDNADTQVRFHSWFAAPGVLEALEQLAPYSGHASWTENFPWTRLEGVELPQEVKPPVQISRTSSPAAIRERLGDGSFGGPYAEPDDEMLRIWEAGVAEVRELLERGWS